MKSTTVTTWQSVTTLKKVDRAPHLLNALPGGVDRWGGSKARASVELTGRLEREDGVKHLLNKIKEIVMEREDGVKHLLNKIEEIVMADSFASVAGWWREIRKNCKKGNSNAQTVERLETLLGRGKNMFCFQLYDLLLKIYRAVELESKK